MTDELENSGLQVTTVAGEEPTGGEPASLSRRMLLRGATATVPVILTLSSGAALARSSNLIGTVQSASGDPILCLDPGSTNGATFENPNVYDLGPSRYAEVTRFPTANKYRDANNPSNQMTAAQACRFKGTLQVQYNGSGQWASKNRTTAGFMVSNAAVASFGSSVLLKDI